MLACMHVCSDYLHMHVCMYTCRHMYGCTDRYVYVYVDVDVSESVYVCRMYG